MTGLPSHGETDVAARPRQFGQYSVVREIGRGGMATVFEAVHGALGKRVALKVMHVDVREKPNAAERFLREARAAAQIRHNHIVNVFDVGTEGGTPFIVMDLVEGPDLAAWLSARGPLSIRQLAELFLPISSAVWSAHRAGIVHRDLKPSNILVCDFPRGSFHPIVVDFGISKILDERHAEPLTHSESLLGTPHYMAPEQIQGSKFVTERTDQYAIGVMLYECATGRRPFDGKNSYELMHAIATSPAPKLTRLDPGIPREFETIVLRAMHREPSKRFPSVHALGCALLSFAGREGWSRWGLEFTGTALASAGTASDAKAVRLDTPVDDRRVPVAPISRERAKSRFWTAIGVAIAALVGAGAAARLLSRRADGAPAVVPDTTHVASSRGASVTTGELATIVAEPSAIEPRGEPAATASTVLLGSPVPAPPKPSFRSRSTPRSAPVAAASNAGDKPAPTAEPHAPRERGENGAFILE